jgi:hypothetical protein
VRPGTFAFWKHTLAHEARAVRPGPKVPDVIPPAFLPVRVVARPRPRDEHPLPTAPMPSAEIEIVLEGRRRVRVRGRVDPAWLGDVLRTVEALGC